MTKLKLGPLPDDKPVKVTVELPAPLHRVCRGASPRNRPARHRSSETDRADAGAVHCHGSRLRQGAASLQLNPSRQGVPPAHRRKCGTLQAADCPPWFA